MKIQSDLFILSVQARENKQKEPYVILSVADTEGQTFQIISKDVEELLKLQQLTKYSAELELTNSKYGLRLEIVGVSQCD